MRIASLLASNTEIAFALGLADQIVGVSHECDYPEKATRKPVLTKSKINPYKKSADIDEDVKNILRLGLSLYEVDLEKLKEANPDLILTQDQCEVCAVSLKDVESALRQRICNAKVISLKPMVLNDLFRDIRQIAKATKREKEGRQLIQNLMERISKIQKGLKKVKNHPTVCCIEWMKPLMAAGNWVPEMIEIAGGISVWGEKGGHSKVLQFQELTELDPEKIIISPCGFKIDQTKNDLHYLTDEPDWQRLRAVQNHEVYLVDGSAYFNRPGPRLVDTIEILAEVIHPEEFGFGGLGSSKSAAPLARV